MTLQDLRIIPVTVQASFDHNALEQEKTWIAMCRKDIRHFHRLYQKYYQPIFRFIFRRTDDEMLTADLCSQTFYKAMIKIKTFTWQGKPLAAWLYRIAANEVKKHFRDRKEVFVIEEDKIIEVEEFRDDWEHMKGEQLMRLLDGLAEQELQLIELRYFEQLTFKEISVLMDMKESALKMKLYRLLLELRKKLEVNHA